MIVSRTYDGTRTAIIRIIGSNVSGYEIILWNQCPIMMMCHIIVGLVMSHWINRAGSSHNNHRGLRPLRKKNRPQLQRWILLRIRMCWSKASSIQYVNGLKNNTSFSWFLRNNVAWSPRKRRMNKMHDRDGKWGWWVYPHVSMYMRETVFKLLSDQRRSKRGYQSRSYATSISNENSFFAYKRCSPIHLWSISGKIGHDGEWSFIAPIGNLFYALFVAIYIHLKHDNRTQ